MNKIYWHIITSIDNKLAKKYSQGNTISKVGDYIGMDSKESVWRIFDDGARDLVIIARYKYVGITYKTGDSKLDYKEFQKLKSELDAKGRNDDGS